MSKELLDDPQIGAALEQMSREAVAQRVRRDAIAEAGGHGRTLHDLPRLLPAEPRPPLRDEHRAPGPIRPKKASV